MLDFSSVKNKVVIVTGAKNVVTWKRPEIIGDLLHSI